jgi:RNA polymerase sigma-70 factor (ECF subfamily)
MGGVVNNLHFISPPRSTTADDENCLDTFQRELDFVYRSLRVLGTAPSDVEDLVQEVFLALRRSWPYFDQTRPVRAHLFGITFRIAAKHRRKNRREIAFKVVEIPEGRPAPDDQLVAKGPCALLLSALERIGLPRRAVLVMHEIDGVPVDEVAAALGIPRFMVYSRLRKARRDLERALRG